MITRLVNQETHTTVVEFRDSETVFSNKVLEKELEEGIHIPPYARGAYGGKEFVYITDKQFQKAFRELYVDTHYDLKKYKWEEIT